MPGKAELPGFSLSLKVPNEVEAAGMFAAFADGGQVQMSLTRTFFSPRFGMGADRLSGGWPVCRRHRGRGGAVISLPPAAPQDWRSATNTMC